MATVVKFKYEVQLKPTDDRVKQVRVRVLENDVEVPDQTKVYDTPIELIEIVAGPDGVAAKLVIDHLDAKGNDSTDFIHPFVVNDEIGPDAPDGIVGFRQVAEVLVEVPDAPPADDPVV